MATKLSKALAKNRAEEFGEDVWENFVVPPFYEKLDLTDARKSSIIVGGRGCGKTMLLRFLSHQSSFSRNRPSIPLDATQHIGLYWRMDTQFARAMYHRGQEEDVWSSAFGHLIALFVGREVLRSLESIARSACSAVRIEELEAEEITILKSYNATLTGNLFELLNSFHQLITDFGLWVSNVRTIVNPTFFPAVPFILDLIRAVKRAFPTLDEAIFYVYVDEFENLLPYQQEIFNTRVKHSEVPLVFNLAMKRNGFETRKTVGEESIIQISDYRIVDIEALLEADFNTFAAEVLFLNLSLAEYQDTPINASTLRDPCELASRQQAEYRARVLSQARRILPNVTTSELAREVFDKKSLKERLSAKIAEALSDRGSTLSAEVFIAGEYPEASIVCSALLKRSKLTPQEVLDELRKLQNGTRNKFSGATNWIHNNIVGCILAL